MSFDATDVKRQAIHIYAKRNGLTEQDLLRILERKRAEIDRAISELKEIMGSDYDLPL